MTFTKNIARKYAEVARKRASELGGNGVSAKIELSGSREVSECVAIWNTFCAEETERLAKKDARNRSFGEILPGVWVASR